MRYSSPSKVGAKKPREQRVIQRRETEFSQVPEREAAHKVSICDCVDCCWRRQEWRIKNMPIPVGEPEEEDEFADVG
jgi:hypothetical protein